MDTAQTHQVNSTSRLRYGALAAPLALVGLPLYVYLPSLFAQVTGLGLMAVGTILLAARAFEALADPFIGRIIQALQIKYALNIAKFRATAFAAAALMSLAVLACLNAGLWLPWLGHQHQQVLALTVCVALAYLCYSWLTITHHAMGTALIAHGAGATALYSTREALALLGVLVGSVLPLIANWAYYGWACVAMLVLAFYCLQPHWAVFARSSTPIPSEQQNALALGEFSLWKDATLSRTWWAFFISNISGSLPATLLGFYVADVLGLGMDAAPRYLAVYFVAAALGFGVWPRLAQRYGAMRVWACAMAANGLVFALAGTLGASTVNVSWFYGAVCAGTGLLLGAELMLPQSIVAKHLAQLGQAEQAGRVFGWWTFAQKTALALAAGLGLWGLAALDYIPGQSGTAQPLVWFYCWVPSMLKLTAAAMAFWIKEAQ
jgi:glycoside/pentoside/hexuronide:cation symporter, GPH family